MNLKKIILILTQFFILSAWTENYVKKIKNNIKNNSDSFTKETILFNQLLVYWNGKKPEIGYWQIKAKVRNASTKKWSKYITLMNWSLINKSCLDTKNDLDLKNYYVRLELKNNTKADAFEILIEAKNGANLKDLDLIGATVSDLTEFKSTIDYKKKYILNKKITLTKISQFKVNHKDFDRICSPTSLTMVLKYLTDKNIDPIKTANQVYDSALDSYGSWQFNVAYASELLRPNYFVHLKRLKNFQDILDNIKNNLPVIVSVRGEIKDAPRPYNRGHVMVVAGYNDKKKLVICYDPAFDNNYKVLKNYPLHSFLKAWNKSNCLAYCFEKK